MYTTVQFLIPRLRTHPVLAAGCCALPAEELISELLTGFPGVSAVEVDQLAGRVIVTYDPGQTSAQDLRAALAGTGYAVDESPSEQ
jgi:copper chaperone CopZ